MSSQQRLIRLLADGRMHSGSEMATALGVSRTAVWKQLGQLDALELDVSARAGQGYQLESPLELLDKDAIAADLDSRAQAICCRPEVLWESASTSNFLLEQPVPEPGKARAVLAEFQTSGRGRRGRKWFAPAGHGICLSVSWGFRSSPANLSCLGLAAGVGVLRALVRSGVQGVSLKWPNDLVIDGRKLAGILIDVQGEAGGPLHVVAGVGLNYRLSDKMVAAIRNSGGMEPASVIDHGVTGTAGRNRIAALLISELSAVLSGYAETGFDPLAIDWERSDYLRDRQITVITDDGELTGIAKGISKDGRLKVIIDGVETLLVTGDVSVRAG